MRVQARYFDPSGQYSIEAEVNPLNHDKMQIVSIRDEYDQLIDVDDFTDEELGKMRWRIKQEALDLDTTDDESEDIEDDSDF